MRLKYFIYILLFLTLSCVKEQDIVPEGTVTTTIPYKAVVQGSQVTRASIDGGFGTGSYIFQDGDRLFIVDPATNGTNLWGVLTLIGGAGSDSGTFEGWLNYINDEYSPTDETPLKAILVGPDAAEGFYSYSISGDKITNPGCNPTYPSSIPYEAGGLAEYVKKYSHFISSSYYGTRRFTLTQQTVFLNFSINLLTSSMTGSPSTVNVDIKSADGSDILHSITGVRVGGSSSIASMVFTTVFPKETSLQGARIVVNNGEGIRCEPDFANDLPLLQANTYYTVSRTNVDPFTVEAPSDGSGATITFNYGDVQYKKYTSLEGVWTDWSDYSEDVALSAGDKVSFRGKNSSYTNDGGSTPLFTTTNSVYIYGDIMSLMCDNNWFRSSAVGEKAFYQAFKGVDKVDIPEGNDLILSATTLGTSCYDSMFLGCTSLTKAPILPATTMALACYRKMFEGCSKLSNVPSDLLPAMTLANGCYARMFWGCTSLVTAPDLPAIVAKPGCYFCMFRSCSKLNSVKCYLPQAGFTNVTTTRPYADTPDPTAEIMSTWTISNLWTVVNKWLKDTCTEYGANKGSFQCPSDMTSIYPDGVDAIGAVPRSKWNISELP